MAATNGGMMHCTVYGGRGDLYVEVSPAIQTSPYRAPVPDRLWVRAIMSKNLVCGRSDLAIETIVQLMVTHEIGCLPIVDRDLRIVGLVTKSDLVKQLDVMPRDGSALCHSCTAGDVMTSSPVMLGERATISEAAAAMMHHGMHHVLIVSESRTLAGVVSSKDIVNWVAEHDGLVVCRTPANRSASWHPDEG
ncbi:MAG: HPP family protein [Kofleriaceae bacterium]